jgi:hypothetical protein
MLRFAPELQELLREQPSSIVEMEMRLTPHRLGRHVYLIDRRTGSRFGPATTLGNLEASSSSRDPEFG